jgi:2-oxoisovalerate dehydrogenase E1 component alpha subunit
MTETDLDLLRAYRLMLLARSIDEREWLLNRQGKIPFVVSCQGQEATQVGLGLALRPGVDHTFPYYRDLGLVLALGMTPYEIFLNLFAKADDPNSGGRQMPNHWAHSELRIYSHSSPVANQIPHAAGVALANRLLGQDVVTLVTFCRHPQTAGRLCLREQPLCHLGPPGQADGHRECSGSCCGLWDAW